MICPKITHTIEVTICNPAKRKTGESLGFYWLETKEYGFAVEFGIKPTLLSEKTRLRYLSYIALEPGLYDVIVTPSSMAGMMAVVEAKAKAKP